MKKFNLPFAFITICFSAFSQAPTITSLSPANGPVGTLVTITGINLSSPTAFSIGGVAAITVSDNGTTLVGMVMPGAASGVVSVTTAGGVATVSNFTVTPTGYPRYQEGPKLVGSAYVGPNVLQGFAVAISGDGNTAIVGAPDDSNYLGAAWVYTRSGSAWAQQGPKLVGTGVATSSAGQGGSVALSADGNTAVVGGSEDDVSLGAVWIFTRSGTTWAQQGPKLVGTGYVTIANAIEQGTAVSMSADGNTVAVGGKGDSAGTGAVWVFTRSGATWSQQGHKLVGSGAGAIGNPNQGYSVALSADGKTILVGGYTDNNGLGASWVFTDSGGIWAQQGPKLVGTDAVDSPYNTQQGSSVALSADGNTAIVGGFGDSSAYGATWVYSRSGGTWHQQGPKLVGAGGIGTAGAWQGYAASLSADGNTTVVGGSHDNSFTGAAWIFVNDTVSSCLSNASSFSHGMCQGDTFTFGNMQIGSSGTYTDTLTNLSGCDSLVTLTLRVNPLPVVTWTQDTFNCNGELVPPQAVILTDVTPPGGVFTGIGVRGDTAQPPNYGLDTIAYVYTDSNSCSNQPVYKVFLFTICDGIVPIDGNISVSIYPNPNKGSFTLQTSNSVGSDYTISDMLGHIIMQQTIKTDNETIELPDAADGVYTLTVRELQPVRFVLEK